MVLAKQLYVVVMNDQQREGDVELLSLSNIRKKHKTLKTFLKSDV